MDERSGPRPAVSHGSEPGLYVVVADVHALLDRALKRGIERKCLQSLRWVIRRAPMRDSGVLGAPLRAVPDLKPGQGKLLVVLDHQGCGMESASSRDIELELQQKLVRVGFCGRDARCLVLEPELEEALVPVWDRIAALMAAKRGRTSPSCREIMKVLRGDGIGDTPVPENGSTILAEQPKECFLSLLRLLNLRHQTALYDEIAREVSLPSLEEGKTGGRLGSLLVEWFGTAASGRCAEP